MINRVHTAPDPPAETEAYNIYAWHIDYFRELGFKRYQAEILHLGGAIPHDAKDLIEQGCPLEHVINILT